MAGENAGGERQHQRRYLAAGLARLPALLKQHQPRWVLVELGGNDGLRGFPPQQTERTLRTIIKDIKAANAEPLLMQIHLPANYGRRYNEAFGAIYPATAKEFAIPLLPFLWRRSISSRNGCRTTAFIQIATRSRLSPTGWRSGWLLS